jgi:putative oxidoreductase
MGASLPHHDLQVRSRTLMYSACGDRSSPAEYTNHRIVSRHLEIEMWKILLRTNNDPDATLLRILLGVVFCVHGAQSLLGWFGGPGLAATIEGFGTMGIPPVVTVLVKSAEFFGGLGLIAGFLTRPAAAGILAVMGGAVYLVHGQFGFFMNWSGQQPGEGFEYHLLAMGMAAALILRGGGFASLDRYLSRRKGEPWTLEPSFTGRLSPVSAGRQAYSANARPFGAAPEHSSHAELVDRAERA